MQEVFGLLFLVIVHSLTNFHIDECFGFHAHTLKPLPGASHEYVLALVLFRSCPMFVIILQPGLESPWNLPQLPSHR